MLNSIRAIIHHDKATMPTPISRILPSSASSASTASKVAASVPEQFQRMLSRQIEQRQALEKSQENIQTKARADARSKSDADVKTRTEANAAQPEAAPVDPSSKPTATREASTEANKHAKNDDEHSVDTTPQPLSSMLTLVASLQQAAAKATDDATTTATAMEVATAADVATATATALKSATADAGPALARAGTGQAALPATALPDLKLAAGTIPAAALPEAAVSDAALPGSANLVAPAAVLQMAQTASAIPVGKLNGQVGSPAWDQQLGQKVIWMAAGGLESATLTLNPPDLGPLQVVLSVSNDQASVSFTSNQAEVRQALEAALPKLRDMMSEAGLSLGNANVSAGSSNQEHGAQQERARQGGGAQGNPSAVSVMTLPALRGTALQGMVDTFV